VNQALGEDVGKAVVAAALHCKVFRHDRTRTRERERVPRGKAAFRRLVQSIRSTDDPPVVREK
jgi:hypothetical protein